MYKPLYGTYKDHIIKGILRIRDIKFDERELRTMNIKQLELIYSFPEKYIKKDH
ncbi:MAG: hypothetical protein PUA49_09345 [Butyrivibrio sp.]|nr:hypothetical protein [Butyrivibrio sp.]